MYQLSFSEQSLNEIGKLSKEQQLQLVSEISEVVSNAFKNDDKTVEKFQRDGMTFYRLKVRDYRVYVERQDVNKAHCHYVLPQHTFSDFLFRSKLPVTDEQMIEQNSSFWKYLESLKKK